MNTKRDLSLEHNYKKILKFMSRSINAFKRQVPNVTKAIKDNIDFLILNYPYFTDINMISEYFMTDNTEFNTLFYTKLQLFTHIIKYNPESDNILKNKNIDISILDKASLNKLALWEGLLGRSGYEKLKSSWLTNKNTEQDIQADMYGISTLNDKRDVLKPFFDILNYHFCKIELQIINFLDMKDLLDNLYIDDKLVRNLAMRHRSTYAFQGVKNIGNILVENEKYDILEIFLEEYDSDISSSEEDVYNELDINKLTYNFLISKKFYEYRTIQKILLMIMKHDTIRIPIYVSVFKMYGLIRESEYDGSTTLNTEKLSSDIVAKFDLKFNLYLELICKNSDVILDEIYNKQLHSVLTSLFFESKNNNFIQTNIYTFILNSLYNQKYRKLAIKLLKKPVEEQYREGYAVLVGPKPHVDNIFAYCLKLINKNERFNKLETLKYSDFLGINEYIDLCVDEHFMRYICKLVVDEIPVLESFRENK